MKRFKLAFLLLFIAIYGKSQEVEESSFAKWSVTVKPMGFFDPFLTNFTVGGLYRVNDKFLTELNVGLIQSWFCTYNQKEDNIKKSGFRLSGEVKYLIHKKLYIAAQVFHNNYTKTNEETIWRYNRAYTQEFDLEKHFHILGGHGKFGILVHNPDKLLFFDFYAGIGARYRDVRIVNLPGDAELVENIDFFRPRLFRIDTDNTGSRTVVSLSLGFSIGWKLSKAQ